jgi:anti-anti-sigma factor
LTTQPVSSGTAITVDGDLDFHSAGELRVALPAIILMPGQQLLIDLRSLAFFDSTGITSLIAARNRALACGATIALIAIPDRVRRLFELAGLQELFPAYPTIQDAEDSWTPTVADE